ncbi:FAD-binding oxidoreductase [Actinokineospora pegani]|uniref:FAD-binding oxidoreductase n=1 Tax=Actinokineospora pegani TaxID=2654637 RepID=UPI0012EA0BC9|nr:FAD-binding oxidoreductase [Actinokineospora pegani]
MDRRTLLRATLAGAAAWTATACTGTPNQKPTTTTTPPPPATTTTPAPPDWNALKRSLDGALALPADADFTTAFRLYNPAFDKRAPAAVARPASAGHVQACVRTARDSQTPITARSGGHSFAGYSAQDNALIVDVRGLNAITVSQDGTATIGAGARLIDVYTALAARGRALPGGTCPSVGIAGLTLGGGLGVLGRKYGLTCDSLIAAQVVTADGRLRTASADSEPDLFWALRGGGGGNFGITTEFTFRTHPAPPVLTTFDHTTSNAVDLLATWQDWVPGNPPELWSNIVLSSGPAARVGGCFVGGGADLAPLIRDLTGGRGTRTSRDYLATMRHFAGCTACEDVTRRTFTASSRVLARPLPDPTAAVALLDGTTDLDILIDSLGGAVAETAPADTAFPHRQALASAQIYQKGGNTNSVAKVRDGLAALGASGAYVNYIDAAMPDWLTAYYGDNAPRLRAVAQRYDPDGVFAFEQGIRA